MTWAECEAIMSARYALLQKYTRRWTVNKMRSMCAIARDRIRRGVV